MNKPTGKIPKAQDQGQREQPGATPKSSQGRDSVEIFRHRLPDDRNRWQAQEPTHVELLKERKGELTLLILLKRADASTFFQRGAVLSLMGNMKGAIKDYSKAIELNPEYAEAYSRRGMAYIMLEKPKKAIQDFTKAMELGLETMDVLNNRGSAHLLSDNYKQALADFERALELAPESPILHTNIGQLYLFFYEDLDKAIKHLEEALKLDPNLPLALDLLTIAKHVKAEDSKREQLLDGFFGDSLKKGPGGATN